MLKLYILKMKGAEFCIKIFLLIDFVYSTSYQEHLNSKKGYVYFPHESRKTTLPAEYVNHKKNENIAARIFVNFNDIFCRYSLYCLGFLCTFIVAICIMPIKYGIDKFRGKPVIK